MPRAPNAVTYSPAQNATINTDLHNEYYLAIHTRGGGYDAGEVRVT